MQIIIVRLTKLIRKNKIQSSNKIRLNTICAKNIKDKTNNIKRKKDRKIDVNKFKN